jgi:hypothetical protein
MRTKRVRNLKTSHQNKLEEYLDRIAVALEVISDNLDGGVQHIEVVTPLEASQRRDGQPGRPHGLPGHCGRCGREGRRRMNGKPHCNECINEGWWNK